MHNNNNELIYASTFLSHSSADNELVHAVANELVRHGIVPWLDKSELLPGVSLKQALTEAIYQQTTVTVFLSHNAIQSEWIRDELAATIELDKTINHNERIIPIYIGDPLELVCAHDLLRNSWLHPDGNRVDRLGIVVDTNKDISILAGEIAEEIAHRIYQVLNIPEQNELVLCIDQRGNGLRKGKPTNIPKRIKELGIPILVFRPDLNQRSQEETLFADNWKKLCTTMKQSLSHALNGSRWSEPKKIRIIGGAQLGFPFFLGHYFNRSTTAYLFCYSIQGDVFNNQHQDRAFPLSGGNAHCETSHPDIDPIEPQDACHAISLLLSGDYLLSKVQLFLKTKPDAPPLVWVKNETFITNDQVMGYISDIVALLNRFAHEHQTRTVYLYCGLPFHVIPLLAANLLHVVDHLIFMEYRRDLQSQPSTNEDMYVPLQMP